MSTAGSKYCSLEYRLLRGRAKGTLTEDEEDRLLEAMDDLWWELSDDERAAANARAAHEASLSPESAALLEAGVEDVKQGRVVKS